MKLYRFTLATICALLTSVLILSCSQEDIYPDSKRVVPENYHPYVKQHKQWNYGEQIYNEDEDTVGWRIKFSYLIEGDTLINGQGYNKLLAKDAQTYGDEEWHYVGAVREALMKVFFVRNETKTEERVYDFGVQTGNKIKWDDVLWDVGYCTEIRETTHDFSSRVISLTGISGGKWNEEYIAVCAEWWEGIGCCGGYNPFNWKRTSQLISCYEDGQCVFDIDYVIAKRMEWQ